jgi:integrase
MIAYVIKRKGSRTWDARIRFKGEPRITQVPLGCTNRQVAEKKLRELLDEKEREAAGLIAPKVEREAANKLLTLHLDDWIEAKERVRDDQYVAGVRGRVLRLIKECGWRYARDVKPEDYTRWRTGSKLSPKTLNDFLTSFRTLLNWMVKQGRIGFNPLRSLDLLPARDEKRRPRRALTEEEASRLVDGSGERGLAYLVALTTGLRLGELHKVEVRDIRLDDASPKIAARAATTKNRKDSALPLHPGVAEQLRAFLAGRNLEADDTLFEPLLRPRRQFKRDLEAVGIPPKDEAGRVVDFHSLRYTFCTNLQRLDVPQRVLMLLMRHSDRRLSDHLYTDTSLLPADETVQMLTLPGRKPSQSASHIPSHDLVPAGQNGSHAVTAANMSNGAQPLMNTGDCHVLACPVTPGQNPEKVGATGFEPARRRSLSGTYSASPTTGPTMLQAA